MHGALEMAALLLDLGPGDTVVVPSFGFVTTALAFGGGRPLLFCDIEGGPSGSTRRLADLMDDSVRAVVPIHYAGVGCDIDGIRGRHRWPERVDVVEDNAHGCSARTGPPLGSFGRSRR